MEASKYVTPLRPHGIQVWIKMSASERGWGTGGREQTQSKPDSRARGNGEEEPAGRRWGSKCECEPWKRTSSTKQGWSNSISTWDWTQEKAPDFGKKWNFLRFQWLHGNTLTGGKNSVRANTETPPAATDDLLWPSLPFPTCPHRRHDLVPLYFL